MSHDDPAAGLDSPRQAVPATASSTPYVVVARRYRPQGFEDLIGQQQVSTALRNAIRTNRVGHAYLFTGARGVGKTSTARILAKALNCEQGPTAEPCDRCDICRSITAGEDVDVLEIDGASNRGIDEIRQLRSNVNMRPSRARFKIYIIDEVHMLTTPAFNALLKTLEEPPEHVKFIFCTTDPEKIPITVLSRCQRFDFAPVETDAIVGRLRHIVQAEQVEADDEALEALARRAAGSMRDSQSLLEQLLAFCGTTIRLEDVHRMLGTAHSGRLGELAEDLRRRDAAAALAHLDAAVEEGVDLGQLSEQLLGYFRDMMTATVGCDARLLRYSSPEQHSDLRETGKQWGLETILAVTQILDQMLARLRQTTQVRTLVEVAVVRICHLENVEELGRLLVELDRGPTESTAGQAAGGQGAPAASSRPASASSRLDTSASAPVRAAQAAGAEKKTRRSPPPVAGRDGTAGIPATDDAPRQTAASAPTAVSAEDLPPLKPEQVKRIWQQALEEMGDMTADYARKCTDVAISAPNRLVARFSSGYTVEACSRAERKARLEETLSRVAGRPVRVDFEVVPETPRPARSGTVPVSRRQRMRQLESHPFVREAMELFGGELTRADAPPKPKPQSPAPDA